MRRIYTAFYVSLLLSFARQIYRKLVPAAARQYFLYHQSVAGVLLFAVSDSPEDLDEIRGDLAASLPPGAFPGEPREILRISRGIPSRSVVSIFDSRGTRGMPASGKALITMICDVLDRHGQDELKLKEALCSR